MRLIFLVLVVMASIQIVDRVSTEAIVNNVDWKDKKAECLPSTLVSALEDLADKHGPLYVNSTHRSKEHNRKVGGAPKSKHITCEAIDFGFVDKKVNKAALKTLIADSRVGGYKLYAGGHFHIDSGKRRTW